MNSSLIRSIISTVVLCSILVAGAVPVLAQRSKGDPVETRSVPRPMQRLRLSALTDGNGVFLTWQSNSESKVVGYNVYRYSGNGIERANRTLIVGGGLGDADEARTGKKFQFFDPSGTYGATYQIEVVSLDGYRIVGGSATAMPVDDLTRFAGASSKELAEADRNSSPEVDTVRIPVPKILAAETQSSLQAPNIDNQKWVANQVAAKIAVRQDGIYRVLKTDLQTAGFDVSGSSRYWRLFADGNEQAIRVASDGSYFEFYGRARDTRESDTRIYYLVTGNVKGKRMASVSARAFAGEATLTSFSNSYVKKYRSAYLSTLLNGDAENYFGDLVSPTQRDFVINLASVDTAQSSIQLTVKLQGIIVSAHSVNVSVNGTPVGTVTGSNKDSYSKTLTVPISAVLEGANTIRMTATAASNDYSFIDSISVSYARKYKADSNRLSFVTGASKHVKVDGFVGTSVVVYDITAPESPQVITNTLIQRFQGAYTASIITNRARSMYAVQDGSALTPASITLNTPSTLSSVSNEAQMIIVSHKNFMNEANAWAAYRAGEGVSVKVVDIEDVFDEFSYGSMSTDGMNAFFAFAEYNWTVNPNYVLLIGDATYDYRAYEAVPFANYVPTRLFDTLYEETGSDDALVDFNGDGLADIPIGRVPARTTAQVTQLFQKTKDFELSSATGLSTRGALFAYDDPVGYDFQNLSQRLAAQLPAGTPTTFVFKSEASAKTNLMAGLNTGKYIVNYSGHGSTGIWSASSFFASSDASSMTNGTNLSVFTMLTCLNGYFISLSGDNLAESLIKANGGGAAASWASTGKTTPDVQDVMANRFYNKLSAGTIPRLGDLIKDAKTVVYGGRDVRLSWVLLGDPLLKMR